MISLDVVGNGCMEGSGPACGPLGWLWEASVATTAGITQCGAGLQRSIVGGAQIGSSVCIGPGMVLKSGSSLGRTVVVRSFDNSILWAST